MRTKSKNEGFSLDLSPLCTEHYSSIQFSTLQFGKVNPDLSCISAVDCTLTWQA